ncbi:hypothetical protein CEXT_727011 [Caerostris extrusa]|uniref:Uncharacterized protein n=1 Tax=Caerostris extrusa TaxID=172846 RepID=A0AAV4Y1U7_CAEEX|nr:hypothetical protein CEXT_727011 [Caerostris extrusa]
MTLHPSNTSEYLKEAKIIPFPHSKYRKLMDVMDFYIVITLKLLKTSAKTLDGTTKPIFCSLLRPVLFFAENLTPPPPETHQGGNLLSFHSALKLYASCQSKVL